MDVTPTDVYENIDETTIMIQQNSPIYSKHDDDDAAAIKIQKKNI